MVSVSQIKLCTLPDPFPLPYLLFCFLLRPCYFCFMLPALSAAVFRGPSPFSYQPHTKVAHATCSMQTTGWPPLVYTIQLLLL